MLKMCVYGDSILKGVVLDEARSRYVILQENCIALLSKKLPASVINRAAMGTTAPMAEQAIRQEDLQPGGIALIELGGNDCDMPWGEIAADPSKVYVPRTPLAAFRAALEGIANRVAEGGMKPIFILPPPLDAWRYFEWVTQNLNRQAVYEHIGDVQHIYRWQERYVLALAEVAAKLACPLLNVREAFLAQDDPAALLCKDGIHPNAHGHRVMLEVLMERFSALV